MYSPPGPPGPPGFPQQPWNPQGPPAGNWGPPPPAPKSSALKWIGLGCGGLLLLGCLGSVAVWAIGRSALGAFGPGEELSAAPVTPGVPFVLSYSQGATSHETRVWLDLDVSFSNNLQLSGALTLRCNGTPIGQYNLQVANGECTSPVRESSNASCFSWRHSQANGQGSMAGQTRLFVVVPQPPNATITLSGLVFASPGTQLRKLRVFASE
jgi:hypothetical protein